MTIKDIDEKTIAKKIIISTLKIEESLAYILREEVKTLKRKTKMSSNADEMQKTNKTIRYVLYYLIIMDDRIQKSLEILNSNSNNKCND